MVLFERTNTGATLTPSGVTLLPHFEAMLASHASVMVKSAQIKSGEEPVLRIASHRMGQVLTLPPALHALQITLGSVTVDIVYADEVRAAELVKAGQVEVGLGVRAAGSIGHDTRLHEVVTSTSPIAIYCRPDHPFSGLGEVAIDDLRGETIVSTRATERLFQDQFESSKGGSRVIVEDAQVALQMVADGVGIAPLARGLHGMASVPVVAVPLAGDLEVWTTVMRRADGALSVAADLLWQFLAPAS